MAYGGYENMDPEYLAMLKQQGSQATALAAGGMGLNAAGTVLQGFGAYEEWKQAEKAREEEKRRYQEQQRMAEEDRRRKQEQDRLEMMFRYGGYAREGANKQQQQYAGFAARTGQ